MLSLLTDGCLAYPKDLSGGESQNKVFHTLFFLTFHSLDLDSFRFFLGTVYSMDIEHTFSPLYNNLSYLKVFIVPSLSLLRGEKFQLFQSFLIDHVL